MDLRDYLAGQAMKELSGRVVARKEELPEVATWIAGVSYILADAMLAEKRRREALND